MTLTNLFEKLFIRLQFHTLRCISNVICILCDSIISTSIENFQFNSKIDSLFYQRWTEENSQSISHWMVPLVLSVCKTVKLKTFALFSFLWKVKKEHHKRPWCCATPVKVQWLSVWLTVHSINTVHQFKWIEYIDKTLEKKLSTYM